LLLLHRLAFLQPIGRRLQGQRTLTSFSDNDLHQEVDAPAGHASFHDLALFARVLLDEAQGEAAEPGEVLGERAVADAAVVFAVGHVERPVKRVLDPPVAANGLGEKLAVAAQAAHVVASVDRFDAVLFTDANDRADRLETFPVGATVEPVRGGCLEVRARFEPPMSLLDFDMPTDGACCDVVPQTRSEHQTDVVEEFAVIPLEREDVVALPLDDLGGDRLLATGRVDRHHGVFEVENPQQLRDGRDFVRFLIGRDLSQRDAAVRRPGAHQVERSQAVLLVVRAPERLAVDGSPFVVL
jgi:hypothetical protein